LFRCGRTWNPPVEKNFFFNEAGKQVAPKDGTFNRALFEKAIEDYKRATMFETNNSMSTSVQCRFSRIDPEIRETDRRSGFVSREHRIDQPAISVTPLHPGCWLSAAAKTSTYL
jgi:hypothetical protein